MADFVAVIRKAVDNLSDNSPENRTKVYDKARAAIRRQLEAMTPRPPEEMVSRQLAKLDEAISEVESEHAPALPADEEETDRLMAELEALVEEKQEPSAAPQQVSAPVVPPPAAPFAPQQPVEPAPRPSAFVPEPPTAGDASGSTDEANEPDPFPNPADDTLVQPDAPSGPTTAKPPLTGSVHDEAFGLGSAAIGAPEARATVSEPMKVTRQGRKSGFAGWAAIAAILVLIAGAGYAAWTQKDTLMALFSGSDEPAAEQTAMPTDKTAEDGSTAQNGGATDSGTEVAAVEPQQSVQEAGGKFTQRLNPDGTETNPGPSPATTDTGPVEGRSVASQSVPGETTGPETPAPETDAGEGTDTAEEQPDEPGAVEPVDEPLGVAQKMFLYEERLDQQSPAVTEGAVTWSTIPDPDNGGPNNLAIRGEISTSDGFSALMTIKKNADRSLPASHIIEVVFALSPEFPGGSINQLQRVSMKQTEQDQGNPLIAVPAQITPDFYMVALNDLAEAVETNLSLLRDRNWIDIPVVYNNGRRALITVEKGATGSEVFNQVLDVWAAG